MSRQFRSDDTEKWKYGLGNGEDGDKVVSTNTTDDSPAETFTGTSGNTSGTAGGSTIPSGALCMIIQSQGTNCGQWELVKVKTGGSTSLTFDAPLQNTYTTGAQIVQFRQYKSVTVNTGVTWSAPAWNGSTGGILGYFCKGESSIVGTISAQGKGFAGGTRQATTGGYGGNGGEGCAADSGKGGWTGSSRNGVSPSGGGQGNSDSWGTGAGAGQYYTGGGGGGGNDGNGGDEGGAGGGGGGHFYGGGGGGVGNDSSSAGSPSGSGGSSISVGGGNGGSGTGANGANSGSQSSTYSGAGGNGQSGAGCNGGGGGGGANANYSNSELVKMFFGGGGGCGGNYGISNQYGGVGGAGGGIICIFSADLTITGTVQSNGTNGSAGSGRGGGGGAGAAGSILMKCVNATLGTTKATATGASGYNATFSAGGGNSSRGIIHIDYSKTLSGTTNPTLDSSLDATIKNVGAGSAHLLAFFT